VRRVGRAIRTLPAPIRAPGLEIDSQLALQKGEEPLDLLPLLPPLSHAGLAAATAAAATATARD